MARKLTFVEVPYLGIVISEGDSWKLGFKELLKPDMEAEFYLGQEGKENIHKALEDKRASTLGKKSSIGYNAGAAGVNLGLGIAAIAAGATPFGIPFAAYNGTLAWKGAGKRRAFGRLAKKLDNGECRINDIDLSGFYELGKELEEMNLEYAALGQARKESMGKGIKGWARRNFSLGEDDEMRDYRVDIISPVYKKLEKMALEKWEQTEQKAYYHMKEAYRNFNKEFGHRERR